MVVTAQPAASLVLVLQVRGLSVEVGGRLVLDGASFTVRARDKVGLVGRNGAGKTSLLRVLGGAADPTAGHRPPHRRPRLPAAGPAPRRRARRPPPPCATCCRAGASTRPSVRIEKLRLRRWRRTRASATSPASPGPRSAFRHRRRLRRREPRSAASPPASGSAPTASTCRSASLSGGERRRVELARILFAGSDVLLLDEPTNHLDADAKDWLLELPARLPRRAARDQPRPRPARRGHHPRAPPRPRTARTAPATIDEYKGTYSAVPRGRGPRTRCAWPRLAAAPGQGDRPAADPRRPLRGQGHARPRWPTASRSGSSRLEDGKVDAPARRRVGARAVPRAAATPGRVVLEVDGLAKCATAARRCSSDVDFDVGRGERLLIMGLNGAGKTSLLRDPGRATEPPTPATFRFGHNVVAGYYAQEHEGIDPGRIAARPHARAGRRRPDDRARGACSACSGSPATRCSRTPARCRAARRPSWRWPSSSPAATTCCCSTSRPTTSTRRLARRRRRGAGRLAGRDGAREPRRRVRASASQPDRVLLMPDGDLDYWSDDLLDLVALA